MCVCVCVGGGGGGGGSTLEQRLCVIIPNFDIISNVYRGLTVFLQVWRDSDY